MWNLDLVSQTKKSAGFRVFEHSQHIFLFKKTHRQHRRVVIFLSLETKTFLIVLSFEYKSENYVHNTDNDYNSFMKNKKNPTKML